MHSRVRGLPGALPSTDSPGRMLGETELELKSNFAWPYYFAYIARGGISACWLWEARHCWRCRGRPPCPLASPGVSPACPQSRCPPVCSWWLWLHITPSPPVSPVLMVTTAHPDLTPALSPPDYLGSGHPLRVTSEPHRVLTSSSSSSSSLPMTSPRAPWRWCPRRSGPCRCQVGSGRWARRTARSWGLCWSDTCTGLHPPDSQTWALSEIKRLKRKLSHWLDVEVEGSLKVPTDGDALVVGDDLVPDGLDCLGVRLHPAHLKRTVLCVMSHLMMSSQPHPPCSVQCS